MKTDLFITDTLDQPAAPDFEAKSAVLSEDRVYRYELWRRFNAGGRYVMFIGLNPSTADECHDDPTIRRCIRFAKDWGFDGLCMTNLFAFRATDPKDMKASLFPIGGHENDLTLRCRAESAGLVIAAWGTHGSYQDRASDVMKMVPNLKCLGLTAEGHPRHPLYLKATSKPIPFN
jgi:hypothetical protein